MENRRISLMDLQPTAAHNFNGSAKAAVKIYQPHINRTLPKTKLAVNKLIKVTTIIEGIINQRPLYVNNETEIITPLNLLTGKEKTIPNLNSNIWKNINITGDTKINQA
jgi:hypothetical protein